MADEILADKLVTMSSDAIYKHRTKDMVDVYSMAHCTKVNALDVFDICEKKSQEIQSFEAFYNKIPEIEHAYNKLRRITGKPDFSEVYSYLEVFIKPFESQQHTELIWDPSKSKWQDCSSREISTQEANNLLSKPQPNKTEKSLKRFTRSRLKNLNKNSEDKRKETDKNKDKKNRNRNQHELE